MIRSSRAAEIRTATMPPFAPARKFKRGGTPHDSFNSSYGPGDDRRSDIVPGLLRSQSRHGWRERSVSSELSASEPYGNSTTR